MPTITRPDGAVIHYEVSGSGYPLLLIAPGGVSSEIAFWERSPFNPIKELSDEFMVIGMDQRHAGQSFAPATAWSWAEAAADQLAVLDAAGVPAAHVMGGCIGCAHAWNLIATTPERVTSAVCQNPVGLDATNSPATFYAMFNETMRLARAEGMGAIAESAVKNPLFVANNGAGPFAPHIAADAAFREQMGQMQRESYIALIVRFRDAIWPDNPPFFTVSEEWMRACPRPLLVLPGADPFHPTGIARLISEIAPNASYVEGPWNQPEQRPDTVATVRAFLRSHTPG